MAEVNNTIFAERRRRRSEQQHFLTMLMDTIPDLIFYKDRTSTYRRCNKAFAQQFIGLTPEEIIGKKDLDFIKSKEIILLFKKIDCEVFESGVSRTDKTAITMADGSVSHFEIVTTPFVDEYNQVIGLIGICRDTTIEKMAEKANVMKSQFLANMSHEIRTPLNGIIGFTDLLNHSKLSAEQQEFVQEVKSASQGLLYIVNDILDFSKIEAGKLSIENIKFPLWAAVQKAVSFHLPKAVEKDIAIHTIIKADVPENVIGDPARLRQILNNLINNAIKFTEQGEIVITVEMIGKEGDDLIIRFEVKDTGIGIPEDMMENLFNPFVQADAFMTRKYGGAGLGLAISKQLVKMLNGDISIESAQGKGAIFNFTIKFKAVDAVATLCFVNGKAKCINRQKQGDQKNSTMHTGNKKYSTFDPKILLVEDNKMNIKIVAEILKSRAITCDIVFDGSEAVQAVMDKNYDIIFMDCQMPVMDGYQSTAKIRELEGNAKHTIIIAMTANAMAGDREKCIDAGMDDYISKPMNFEIMFNMIEQYAGAKAKSVVARQEQHNKNFLMESMKLFMLDTGLQREDAREIFNFYINSVQKQVQTIENAIVDDDFEAVKRLAHKLKGSSGNLRIKNMYELMIELEESAIEKDKSKCAVILVEIKKLTAIVMAIKV